MPIRAAVIIVVLLCPLCFSADWPQWGGRDNRNNISDEKDLPDGFVPGANVSSGGAVDLSTARNVRWVARLGSNCYGNPTVAGGRVFVGTDDQTVVEDSRLQRARGGLVKCFDEKTGRLLWQLVTPERTGLPKQFHFSQQYLGCCSSPTVEGDRAYVIASDGNVLCLDVRGQADGNQGPFMDEGKYMVGPGKPAVALKPTDADIIWKTDLIDDVGVAPHDATSCSILIHGDVLYLGTSNGVDQGHEKIVRPDAPAFVALDKKTGRLLAREHEGLSSRLFHCQWSSPSLGMVDGKALIFVGGGDGFCYAFEELTSVPEKPIYLKKAWSYDCNPPQYRLRDGQPIRYTAGDKRKKGSPNKNDGTYVGPSDVIATPVFLNNRIYVAIGQDPAHGRGRGMFHCIDATKSGDITQSGRIWTYDALERTIATATIADGLVYITDIAGKMHCLDADTGKPKWVFESKAETWGGALVADGKVYFGNQREFFIMQAGPELKLLGTIRLRAAVYSTPVAANGTVYIATQRHLWAVGK